MVREVAQRIGETAERRAGSRAERAPLLRLVGRMPRLQVAPWGFSLVATALKDEDLEVRDAAIKALELWRGPVALKILLLAVHRRARVQRFDLAQLLQQRPFQEHGRANLLDVPASRESRRSSHPQVPKLRVS
jgi:hypothetical protein